jgi:hypothetical protein
MSKTSTSPLPNIGLKVRHVTFFCFLFFFLFDLEAFVVVVNFNGRSGSVASKKQIETVEPLHSTGLKQNESFQSPDRWRNGSPSTHVSA